MKCPICSTRKPRRQCRGVKADICSICCANEREATIACPLDCPYLREARTREKAAPHDPAAEPNADIQVTESFLREHQEATVAVGVGLRGAVAKVPGVVDSDVRDGLDALILTYRSKANGIVYKSHPVNPYAVRLYNGIESGILDYRGFDKSVRDADILTLLVLYQRMALTYDNGRSKCRAFIDFLETEFKGLAAPETAVVQESPRLIEL